MNNNNADTMIQETDRRTLRGELALIAAVLINSFGVVLMLYSGAGISAISSVPFAFSEVFTKISLGTWTYLFQGLLVLTLMILRKKFVPQYLFSFVVGFAFGEFLDIHELWIGILPQTIPCRIVYFDVKLYSDLYWNCIIQPMQDCQLFRQIYFQGNFPILSVSDILKSKLHSM